MLTAGIGLPVRNHWLLSPKAAILRQGAGRIQDPFPTPQEAAAIPARFIGTVATSYWLGAGLAGWEGPLALSGEAGVRHTTNPGHVAATFAEAGLRQPIGIGYCTFDPAVRTLAGEALPDTGWEHDFR